MSVLKDKRTESPLHSEDMAQDLRVRISTDLIQHLDNGLYKQQFATEHNTHITTEETYPPYIIEYLRKDILETMHDIVTNIVKANAIFPVYMDELTERQILQDYAIGYAESLRAELKYTALLFPQTLHCLLHYADDIDHLIKTLRKWKRANGKIAKRIREHSETDFCNVNNNGNANNNGATGTLAVSPDFVECKTDSKPEAPTMKGECTPAE